MLIFRFVLLNLLHECVLLLVDLCRHLRLDIFLLFLDFLAVVVNGNGFNVFESCLAAWL
jgi:hypothetical protein